MSDHRPVQFRGATHRPERGALLVRTDRVVRGPRHLFSSRTHSLLLLAFVVIASLACSNGQMKPGITLESINNGEAFDDLFSQKRTTHVPSSRARQSASDGSQFFTSPGGWSLVGVDNDSGVYKLKNDAVEGASIVISYDRLEKDGDDRLPELEVLHDNIITRLPEGLVKMQADMTRHGGEPRYHTMLRGKPSADSEELIVSGYTVAIEQDAFSIFAAYPSTSHTLASDIESLVYSLKPYAPIEQRAENAPDDATKKAASGAVKAGS